MASNDHDDRLVPHPPSAWQKKVMAVALLLPGRARTALQKKVIRLTREWRKKTGWKPPKPKPDPDELRRQKIYDWCKWSESVNYQISYSQSRPKDDIRGKYRANYLPTDLDCSSHAIRAYQIAGAPSPSVYGFSGYGSTYDMEGHGRRVSTTELKVGDLIFYRGHVAVYMGNGYVCSHGGQSGPVRRHMNYRSDRTSNRRYF